MIELFIFKLQFYSFLRRYLKLYGKMARFTKVITTLLKQCNSLSVGIKCKATAENLAKKVTKMFVFRAGLR